MKKNVLNLLVSGWAVAAMMLMPFSSCHNANNSNSADSGVSQQQEAPDTLLKQGPQVALDPTLLAGKWRSNLIDRGMFQPYFIFDSNGDASSTMSGMLDDEELSAAVQVYCFGGKWAIDNRTLTIDVDKPAQVTQFDILENRTGYPDEEVSMIFTQEITGDAPQPGETLSLTIIALDTASMQLKGPDGTVIDFVKE